MSTYADIHENMIPCANCGELHEKDDMTETVDGFVCENCRDEDYGFCEHCGEWVHMDTIVEIDDGREYWCLSCAENNAYQCDICYGWFTSRRLDFIEGQYGADSSICDSCSYNYRQCADCGAVIDYDDAYYDDYDDDYLCSDCYSRRNDGGIRNYSYKPEPDIAYRGNENHDTTLTFGIELEVDGVDSVEHSDRRDTAKEVTQSANGRLYCKSDGSLEEGFEIVSHPASLAHHMYQMSWANIMRICKNAGFRSHETETCGLHIHVGKMQLGIDEQSRENAVGNLVILANTLRNDLTKFSRRKSEHLNRWAAFPNLDFASARNDSERIVAALGTRYNGRYQAVNLQNRHTVEFRIFRGTLKRDTLIASIQLVSNLCKYAMSHTPTECTTVTFADIVAVAPHDELVSYSRNKRLIATELVVTAA